VLLRPVFTERLRKVMILGTDGPHSFLDNEGSPNVKHMSDHLPLLTVLSI
jgi:hypothetical protein